MLAGHTRALVARAVMRRVGARAGAPTRASSAAVTATPDASEPLAAAQKALRNFAILAHIDHGKSTLADRLMEATGTITASARKERPQMLDTLVVERARGITIKANSVSMTHAGHTLNLIDTPGHVDFSYEVSRSLEACQGALLLVDASQGVQAQTLANASLARARGLAIIPVVNKIDLPSANVPSAREQLSSLVGAAPESVLCVSAKTGEGVAELLAALVARVPPPSGNPLAPTRMLLFDSWFDSYRGVVLLMAVRDGAVRVGDTLLSHATGKQYVVSSIGVLKPAEVPVRQLACGEVGVITATMRNPAEAMVGDTFFGLGVTRVAPRGSKAESGGKVAGAAATAAAPTASANATKAAAAVTGVEAPAASVPARVPITEFRLPKPMVFAGVYPVDPAEYESLRTAVDRLVLNDPSVTVRPEQSAALGSGFRCGFLGLLHMDVFRQRLETEYDADVLNTVATVPYEFVLKGGAQRTISTAIDAPNPAEVVATREPMVNATLVCPPAYVGAVLQLCEARRGRQLSIDALNAAAMVIVYRLPLAEVITDFFDTLKSRTAGYASFDYEECGYEPAPVGVLSILINNEPIDALSAIVHRDRATAIGKRYVSKLAEVIPRQMFEMRLQAAYGSKVVARETIKAFRKNVTEGMSGGDITRKRKLLEKQKAGKKHARQVGRISVPKEAFMSVLKADD